MAGRGAARAVIAGAIDDFAAWCGWTPYPGTLNLRVTGIPRSDAHHVLRVRSYRWMLWRADIDGIDCVLAHVTPKDGTGSDPTQVEMIAPVRLRAALDVVDGDTVTVNIPAPEVGGTP